MGSNVEEMKQQKEGKSTFVRIWSKLKELMRSKVTGRSEVEWA